MQDPQTPWHLRPSNAPALAEDDTIVFDEPGRIIRRKPEGNYDVDCRSHWFRLVKNFGGWFLLVRHGAGDERIRLGYRMDDTLLELLPSDARYRLLWQIMETYHDGVAHGTSATESQYRLAFVDGRLKKRKVKDGFKVWIEPEP